MKLPVKMILRGETVTVRQIDFNQIDNTFDKENLALVNSINYIQAVLYSRPDN